MEQIAQASSVSRSTLYVHFQDKDQLLQQIAEDYGTALCTIVDRLPRLLRSRAEIRSWIDELASFIARERIPSVLITRIAERDDSPASVRQIGDQLVAKLAQRLPGLADALGAKSTREHALAHVMVVLRELGWACLQAARRCDGVGAALVSIAADTFDRFVRAYAVKGGA